MGESIHGHDVMEMMVASDKSYTKESLKADIREFLFYSKFRRESRLFLLKIHESERFLLEGVHIESNLSEIHYN